jgi:stearoyl-CoA desaturase (delta-9 desaturase)
MTHLQGGLINWYAHKIGYKNFYIHNSSTNILPFDFIFLGEGHHNNHHKYQSRNNFGKQWFEIDITYNLILVLDYIGIIQMKKNLVQ